MGRKIQTGEVVFSPDEKRIVRKIYLNSLDGRTPETILFGKDVGTTRDAAAELKDLFGGAVPFDTAKPTRLVRHVLNLGGVQAGDIVLDFFAGSGATAQAVLEETEPDVRHPNFILIQLPEPTRTQRADGAWEETVAWKAGYRTIAEITKERVRRVIKKLNAEDSGKLDLDGAAKQDRGFRVFKLADSSFKPWNAEVPHDTDTVAKQLEAFVEHVRDTRGAEDLLYELLLKSGFPLTAPVETLTLAEKSVYGIAGGAMLVCLERELTLDLIRAVADRKPERVVCLDEGFSKNDQLKANAVQLFKTKGVAKFQTV